MTTASRALVYMAGSRWEDVKGTDHHLALALARTVPVLWVDPPLPIQHHLKAGKSLSALELSPVASGITRLRSLSLPGFTKPWVAPAANRLLASAVRSAVKRLFLDPIAILLSSPTAGFPVGVGGIRVLYATDDWLSGARMLGLERSLIKKALARNLAQAELAAAISPPLAASLDRMKPTPQGKTRVVPNGCQMQAPATTAPPRARTAALVGQLNERLDLGVLEALQDAGVPLLVIGPRTDRDPKTRLRLDRFLASENVTWLGQLPFAESQKQLSKVRVGITPYEDNQFNRASFPLKTLDYLAAGLPVVATDLPAVRWLNTRFVAVGSEPQQFVRHVQRILDATPDYTAEQQRRAFAGTHSWQARASLLLSLIEGVSEDA